MDIDYMIPGCENLVGQAMEMDQLVFLVSSTGSPSKKISKIKRLYN